MTVLLRLPHVSLQLRRCHMCLQSFAPTSLSLSDFPLLYNMIGGVFKCKCFSALADCVLDSILASRVV